jgi:hypothetical protein
MKIQIIIVMFLLTGIFFIISNSNIHLNRSAEAKQFFVSYANWFIDLAHQSSSFTGYVINNNWLPKTPDAINNTINQTNKTK